MDDPLPACESSIQHLCYTMVWTCKIHYRILKVWWTFLLKLSRGIAFLHTYRSRLSQERSGPVPRRPGSKATLHPSVCLPLRPHWWMRLPCNCCRMMAVKDHGWRVVLDPLLLLSTVVGEMLEVMIEDQVMAGHDNQTLVQNLEDQ